MTKEHFTARSVFGQSDGEVTKSYYASLSQYGPLGKLAVALFRAQKRSEAAKRYRRREHTEQAYGVKNWSLGQVVEALQSDEDGLGPMYERYGIDWGWKQDRDVLLDGQATWVLYVDLFNFGQCSFHSPTRGAGKEYGGEWVGRHGPGSREVILQFCVRVEETAGVIRNF